MVSRGSLSGSFSKANRFLQRRIFPHRILECLRWIARYLLRSFQTISSTSQTRGDEQFTQPTTADGDRKTASPAATTLIGGQARAPSARPAYESEVVNRQAWDRRKSNSDRKLLHTIKGGPSEHPLYLHIGHIKLYGWRFSGLSTKLNNVRAYGLEGRRILSLSARVHSKCLQFVLDFGSWFWSAGGEAIPPIVGKLRWLFLFGPANENSSNMISLAAFGLNTSPPIVFGDICSLQVAKIAWILRKGRVRDVLFPAHIVV